MTIEILLTLAVIGSAAYSLLYFSNPIVRGVLFTAYAAAVFFVWRPEASTTIARFLGMGRGLDVLLVVVTLIVINGIFVLIRLNAGYRQDLTGLARHIALKESQQPSPIDHPKPSLQSRAEHKVGDEVRTSIDANHLN